MEFLRMVKEEKGSQAVRRGVQFLFLIIVCFIGFRFSQFAGALEKGMLPLVDRPPGVEVFLPIGALVSLKYFVFTGIINEIHPSGLVLFLIICATAVVIKKGFCSWVCPFGLLSEYLSKVHYLIFKQGVRLPLWLDRILRGIKYLLAGFFIWTIFFKMPLEAIERFINSPYNILADIKMFKFFTQISMTAFFVILGLILLSVLIRNFWCRYLCPYGAILGVLSFLSLGRIKFNPSHCSNCGKCEKICPGLINIRQGKSSFSSECSTCLQCVNVCPEEGALKYSFFKNRFSMGSIGVGLILLIMFSGGIAMARMAGHWENRISKRDYFFYMMTQGMMDKPIFDTEQSGK
ncbi:MAG: 4Fe-4S binding protein [Desulfobacula sp.]|uniref:4Fe-4S binding protein n=1 Tax=Desulfobacula sp. TaxID=2593537 RepID=UPI0025C050F0|nr:4Fe-4S binding protein [Desulfobacula sp.]MCD4721373.1 4Fe-4S binding protein [Desulfobacula sp.]